MTVVIGCYCVDVERGGGFYWAFWAFVVVQARALLPGCTRVWAKITEHDARHSEGADC